MHVTNEKAVDLLQRPPPKSQTDHYIVCSLFLKIDECMLLPSVCHGTYVPVPKGPRGRLLPIQLTRHGINDSPEFVLTRAS